MARLYADEQFPFEVVEHLCNLGHDVLTVQAAGNANLKIPDALVLEFATSNERVVLTLNRKDFKRLHRLQFSHAGIIICTDDDNRYALAARIDAAILAETLLSGKLISVVRPAR
jgi:predicted nuclease of predicted toxin-antitoxin system